MEVRGRSRPLRAVSHNGLSFLHIVKGFSSFSFGWMCTVRRLLENSAAMARSVLERYSPTDPCPLIFFFPLCDIMIIEDCLVLCCSHEVSLPCAYLRVFLRGACFPSFFSARIVISPRFFLPVEPASSRCTAPCPPSLAPDTPTAIFPPRRPRCAGWCSVLWRPPAGRRPCADLHLVHVDPPPRPRDVGATDRSCQAEPSVPRAPPFVTFSRG